MLEPKTYYRRHLPHYQPECAQYHVVFRLAGSLPTEVIERLRAQREVEEQRTIAEIVHEAILSRHGKEYDLYASTIMPNHVHMVFELTLNMLVGRDSSRPSVERGDEGRAEARPTTILTDILRLIKGSTARECNKLLERTGVFWQHESYDHVIRTGKELERTIWYVLFNPVKAGLVLSWEQWPWTYVKTGLV